MKLSQISLLQNQTKGAYNANYYLDDLLNMDDLPAAGESLISNCQILQPEKLLLLTNEIKDQILFMCSQLNIPYKNTVIQTLFDTNSQILAADNKHIQQATISQALINWLNKKNQASYIMQHPEAPEYQLNNVAVKKETFNLLNLKQNLPIILHKTPFLIQQESFESREALLQHLLTEQKKGRDKIVIKNPNIEGGFGVQLIQNLKNENKKSLIEKIKKLGHSTICTSEEFTEGTEYSTQFKVINGKIIVINNSLQIIDGSSHIGNILSNHLCKPSNFLSELTKIIQPYFTNFSGLFGIDYILTNKNQLKVLEINPRFTGNSLGSNLVSLFANNFFAVTIYENIKTEDVETFNSSILNKTTKLDRIISHSTGLFPLQWSHVGNYGKVKWLICSVNKQDLIKIISEHFPDYSHLEKIQQLLHII